MTRDIILQEIEAAESSIESLRAQIATLQSFVHLKTVELQGVASMRGAEAWLMMRGSAPAKEVRVYGDGKRERLEGVA